MVSVVEDKGKERLYWQFHGKVCSKMDLMVHFVLIVNLLNLLTWNISSHVFSMLSSFPHIHPYSFPTVSCKYIRWSYMETIKYTKMYKTMSFPSSPLYSLPYIEPLFLYRTIFLKLICFCRGSLLRAYILRYSQPKFLGTPILLQDSL